ncbi:hypothetical protein C2869_20920 [Saccharobesus litoralis]|uniref:Cache domain-containing protein n=1 Tax=Saccharobesus litoralis TaxID=2172099 RepID=A0A2S0VWV9_9ALTE|nr:hypothetical protein [Saccharobesus litoralis]AWB68706.1 hypothetical protein C2869_20920 [Saccharobesus litoralis]
MSGVEICKQVRFWKLSLLILAFVGLINTAYIIFDLIQEHKAFQVSTRLKVQEQTVAAAKEIGENLAVIMRSVDDFADDITQLENKAYAHALLKHKFENDHNLYSLNVTFEPYWLDADVEYVSPYYERLTGPTQFFNLTDYDQREVEFSWFYRPMEEGPIWTEPYYEPKNDVLMTTYSVPFYASTEAREQGKLPIGVVPSDIGLDHLTTALKTLKLGMSGYGMIFSQDQNLISHPIFSYVRDAETYQSLAEKPEFSFLPKISQCLDADTFYRFYNGETMNRDEDFAACTKIPYTNWTLITLMSADMFEVNRDVLRQDYMKALAWGIFTLLVFVVAVTGANRLKDLSWHFTIMASLLLTVGTVSIWVLARSYYAIDVENSVSIANVAQREAFKESYTHKSKDLHLDDPIFVPTGMMIESLEFITANNVQITGHIWQKFLPEWQGIVQQKIVFPEAIESKIEEAYRRKSKLGEQLVGWRFNVVVRQSFDYSKYPFDHKNVWIRLWPGQFAGNVVLVPDLESYEQLSPVTNPAIVEDIVLNEWQLKESQYKYIFHHYNGNFGDNANQTQDALPELYYNINIERAFISPFVTTLLPVVVIVGLLFAAVISMAYSQYDEYRNNATAIIFTILLAHYSIRERLSISEVVYFEFFYFLLYIIISVFLVIGHQFYKAKAEGEQNLFTYDNNKISCLWYWPIITGAIFIMTMITYY